MARDDDSGKFSPVSPPVEIPVADSDHTIFSSSEIAENVIELIPLRSVLPWDRLCHSIGTGSTKWPNLAFIHMGGYNVHPANFHSFKN